MHYMLHPAWTLAIAQLFLPLSGWSIAYPPALLFARGIIYVLPFCISVLYERVDNHSKTYLPSTPEQSNTAMTNTAAKIMACRRFRISGNRAEAFTSSSHAKDLVQLSSWFSARFSSVIYCKQCRIII